MLSETVPQNLVMTRVLFMNAIFYRQVNEIVRNVPVVAGSVRSGLPRRY